MALKTREEYIQSLRDGREIYMDGRRIEDVTEEPVLDVPVAYAAGDYDHTDPERRALMTYINDEGEEEHRIFQIPTTPEELRTRIELLRNVSIVTATAGALFALLNVKDQIGKANPKYAQNIINLYNYCRKNDLRIAEVITDAKGDRSRHPANQDDPDLYLRVVEKREDGIVVRGAKLHITGAAFVHELVVLPTKAMSPGEEEYSVAFSIPVATPGVKIINRGYGTAQMSTFDFPVSGHHNVPEGFVIFDDVFVPWDRVFLCGETEHAATFAHALGLWERVGGLIAMVDRSKLFVGMAQLLAEYHGINKASHIVDKICELMFYAELLRMSLETAVQNHESTPSGMLYPNPLNVNVGKYYGAANYHSIVRHIHDMCGGIVITLPLESDLRNPETRPYLEKYLHTKSSVDIEDRMRLINLIRDITADSYGGWEFVTMIQAGGGLMAQKIVSYRSYDLEGAKDMARRAAGIGTGTANAEAPATKEAAGVS